MHESQRAATARHNLEPWGHVEFACHFWGRLLLTGANAQPNVSELTTSFASQIADSPPQLVINLIRVKKRWHLPLAPASCLQGTTRSVAGEKRPERSGFDMARSPRHAEPLTMGLYSTPSVATAWVLGGIHPRVAQIEDKRKTQLNVWSRL